MYFSENKRYIEKDVNTKSKKIKLKIAVFELEYKVIS